MNKPIPAASTTLDLVRRLKEAIADAKTREEKIESDYRLVVARAKRECDEALVVVDADRDNQLAAEQSAYFLNKEATEAKHLRREQWIAAAFTRSESRLVSSIKGAKTKEISHVQTQTLDAKRRCEADLSEVEAQAAALTDQLRNDKSRFLKLREQARAALRGFPMMARPISAKAPPSDATPAETTPDVLQLREDLNTQLDDISSEVEQLNQQALPKLFRFLPLQWLLPVAAIAIGITGYLSKWPSQQFGLVGAVFAGIAGLLLVLQRIAAKPAAPVAASLASKFSNATQTFSTCSREMKPWLNGRKVALEEELETTVTELNQGLSSVIKDAEEVGADGPSRIAQQERRVSTKNIARHQSLMGRLESGHTGDRTAIQANAENRRQQTEQRRDQTIAEAEATREQAWKVLEEEWKTNTTELFSQLQAGQQATSTTFKTWNEDWMADWSAPAEFCHTAPFGTLKVDAAQLSDGLPESEKLALPGNAAFEAPLNLDFPHHGSLLLETESSADPQVIGALNNIMLRLLSSSPAGKLSFSIFDPVGLGQNFAGVTHLTDYEDSIINGRIWTQRDQMEARIRELNEHMEKVIQMYLRNEYETIADYNQQAGNIAEKYHFLVIADFPNQFSEQAIRGLLSIAASGARCGIHTLIHWDKRQTNPDALEPDDLRKNSLCINGGTTGAPLTFANGVGTGTELVLSAPPADALATDFVHRIGKASSDSNRIEVPFSQIMPPEEEYWQNDTTDELRIPIGRTGATKLQHMAIGKGTRQHALFAGKTGSGKSTLFHVMITNLALSCSPEQVEFYLVDFKKGVEFKCYGTKKLPHARVIAIESDREFGLSVLQRLDEELKNRGERFRELGVQDVAGFKKAGGGPLPRTLLMIDEFQEFFVEDDKIAQQASVLLDRIVRQGRAFGIHVLLGSQTLGGAYSLAKATLGQMVIRVALMCNEADAYLIMDETNSAPRLLTRPGEGIYNDSAGAIEGNSPFQTVWLPEEERDQHLDTVRALVEKTGITSPAPVVFEGNAPADIADNEVLNKLLKEGPSSPASPKLWLGAPNAIKGPTEAVFHRQSGNHLLVVGQRDDAVLAMTAIGLITLGAQFPKDALPIYVLDGSAPESSEREFLSGVCTQVPQKVKTSYENDVVELIGEIAAEMAEREEHGADGKPPVFVFIGGIQRYKKLRYDEDLAYSFDKSATEGNPSVQFNDIITNGASLGIHLVAAVDSYNNITRCLNRKALGEFEKRITFQMSANDSAALIDSTAASGLGMHRALFYNEHEGHLETFRPYAAPGASWVNSACTAR